MSDRFDQTGSGLFPDLSPKQCKLKRLSVEQSIYGVTIIAGPACANVGKETRAPWLCEFLLKRSGARPDSNWNTISTGTQVVALAGAGRRDFPIEIEVLALTHSQVRCHNRHCSGAAGLCNVIKIELINGHSNRMPGCPAVLSAPMRRPRRFVATRQVPDRHRSHEPTKILKFFRNDLWLPSLPVPIDSRVRPHKPLGLQWVACAHL